jgi:hypothetical protein
MGKKPIRIVYGLFDGAAIATPKVASAYVRARKVDFPNCDDVFLGGCVVRAKQARNKWVCPQCNATRDAWLTANCPEWTAAAHDPSGF